MVHPPRLAVMSRLTRTRIRYTPLPSGQYTGSWGGVAISDSNSNTTTHDPTSKYVRRDFCSDSHGRPVVPSSLDLTHRDFSDLGYVNGSYVNIANGDNITCTNYAMAFAQGRSQSDVIPAGIPSEGADMAKLLSRTNPSRPGVTPLTLLQDLTDIPQMLKDVGRLIRTPPRKLSLRDAANQHLGARFGWLPLIQDVKDLLHLQDHIHQRSGELKRLYDRGGLKRRLKLGNWTTTLTETDVPISTQPWLSASADLHTISKTERWGTVRWLPDTLPGYNPSDKLRNAQATALVTGITFQGLEQGAWDLIPWTWLIEWFANVKDFATTNSNAIPAHPVEACIMTHRVQTRTWKVRSITPTGLTWPGGSDTFERKFRYVGAPSLDVHLPFIDGSRLSILGSLFVQRFKKR